MWTKLMKQIPKCQIKTSHLPTGEHVALLPYKPRPLGLGNTDEPGILSMSIPRNGIPLYSVNVVRYKGTLVGRHRWQLYAESRKLCAAK